MSWPGFAPILFLSISNVFMTFAWYGQLKFPDRPLWIVILVSWAIAFVEYCFAVPANRIGHEVYSAAQLKTMQEIITLIVFGFFPCCISTKRFAGIMSLPSAASCWPAISPSANGRSGAELAHGSERYAHGAAIAGVVDQRHLPPGGIPFQLRCDPSWLAKRLAVELEAQRFN